MNAARRITIRLTLLILAAMLCTSFAGAAGDPAVDAGWQRAVVERLLSEEYHARPVLDTALDKGSGLPGAPRLLFEAANRAHGFRVRFVEGQVVLTPRLLDQAQWSWSLALSAIGRPGSMAPVGEVRISASEGRIECRRAESLEWFQNDARGLEHGLILHERPAGEDLPLWVEIETGGSLHPRFAADGQAVELLDAQGHVVVHYAKLLVTDARGEGLAARMEGFVRAGRGGIRLVIDDADASYPLSIDPLATSASWEAPGDQDFASFGFAVLTAGDVNGDGYSDVIVGAPEFDDTLSGEGGAFVFLGSASGLDSSSAWRLFGGQAGAHFGHAAGTAGDVNGDGYSDVIVGAYGAGHPEIPGEGRAYVYLGSASGLMETPDWTGSGGQEEARYGYSVATAGDVNADGFSDVIVGADRYTNASEDAGGAAFVYLGSKNGLEAAAAWSDGCNQDNCEYGFSVATAGDVDADGDDEIIVGAYRHSEALDHDGHAMVYLGASSGLEATPSWVVNGDEKDGQFGISVATAGDVNGDGYADVIIGADMQTLANPEDGKAYVYYGSSFGLETTPQPELASRQGGAHFGHSVATAGDVNGDGYADVVVGAYGGENGEVQEGLAYVFHGGPGKFNHIEDWRGEANRADAAYGWSVGTAGDVNGDGISDVIVGAPYADMKETDDGGAFVYHGAPAVLADDPTWQREGGLSNERFGSALSRAGDVNGDGYADFIVGAGGNDKAYVFHGGPNGPSTTPDWTKHGDNFYGEGVSLAGDVNGDGYDDVLVACDHCTNGESEEGIAYLYLGSAGGLAADHDWIWESNDVLAHMVDMAGGGDVNGDGYADVLIGCKGCENASGVRGRVWLFLGSPDGLSITPDWTLINPGNSANWYSLGAGLDNSGDVNGDGYDDIIIGSPLDNAAAGSNSGKLFLFYGGPSGPAPTADWIWEGPHQYAKAGTATVIAGDINGDGFADLVIGASGNTATEIGAGQAYAFYGSAIGPGSSPDWTITGDATTSAIGDAVAGAGDINGDGYADVLIGEYLYDGAENEMGRAGFFLGSASGLPATADWLVVGDRGGAKLSESIDCAGDVNGDGYADLLIAAEWWDDAHLREGKVYLYAGNEGFGRSLRPRQRHANGDPLPHLGASDSLDAVRLDVLGHLPAGAVRTRVAVEVEPYGSGFDGVGIERSSFVSGVPGGTLSSRTVSGLSGGPRYHWRMRVESLPTRAPFQWWGRWLTTPWNGSTDADFREAMDQDGDGYPDAADCAPQNGSVWASPSVVRNLGFEHDGDVLVWEEPAEPGCETPQYDLIKNRRGPEPEHWFGDVECVVSDITGRDAEDTELPSASRALYYLVRVENDCGSTLGTDSSGVERDAIACP